MAERGNVAPKGPDHLQAEPLVRQPGTLPLNPLSVSLVYPILPLGMALFVSERDWGLLNSLDVPYGLELAAGVIHLDFTIISSMPFTTTGLRFHPIEILVSMGPRLAAVAALGLPASAVLIFEVALNATLMFNHSNVRIPEKIDRMLRLLVVTPDMHLYHSVIIRETNSNYGFNLPWWDRLLGTYKAQPAEGHQGMTIGLSCYRDPRKLSLPKLLILPFTGDPGRVPINRH